MSNVSIAHTVVPFKAGDKPLTGQRLAKVGYKSTKQNPALYPSIAVSVDFLQAAEIQENLTALLPYIGTMLEGVQDKIVRSLYESSKGNLAHVTNADISVAACIGYLASENEGNRLTSQAIELWFDSELSDNLTAYIAAKLGYEDLNDAQLATVGKHVKIFRDVLASLAGGKTMLAEKQIKGCRTALSLCPDDSDVMATRLSARLDSMEKKSTEDMLDL